jgi:hypothetical protein
VSFSIAYPWWFIALCLVAGLLVALFLYYKKRSSFATSLSYWLAAFSRFAAFSLLAFMLLSPILKLNTSKTEKPIIFYVQDNSSSQKMAFRKIDSASFRKNIENELDILRKDYTVKTFSFGNDLHDTASYTYNEKLSDISNALEKVITSHENENVGAIILSSDGIYNKGNNPALSSPAFAGSMYTIGIGDTTSQKDAAIMRVYANKIVYLGDKFSLRTDVSAFGASGSNMQLSVFSHTANRVISTQNITATNNRFSKNTESILDANAPGIHHYTITVSKLSDEQNITNNAQDIYVEVIDAKEKVLIVCNSPHPDVNAIQQAIAQNKNYKVDITTAERMNKKVSDYNLIILHNIPSVNYNGNSIIDAARNNNISVWYIVGSQTAIPLLNNAQSCVQIGANGSLVDILPTVNNSFNYFTLLTPATINQMPPLTSPAGNYKIGTQAQTLMYQRGTQNALWTLQQGSNARISVLVGEGLWRWRLYNYKQYKNYNVVDDYINKTIKYLSVKNDKQPFRATIQKSIFAESEPIIVDAELYNNSYELINSPDVTLQVVDADNKKYTFTMNKNDRSYSLNIGTLAAGSYNYAASTSYNGQQYSSNGSFKVIAQNIEDMNTTADFGILNQLAKNYNGEFLQANQVGTLSEKIKANKSIKNVLRTELKTNPLIDWKWIFAVILALLALEWYLRKRNGSY